MTHVASYINYIHLPTRKREFTDIGLLGYYSDLKNYVVQKIVEANRQDIINEIHQKGL